MLEADKKKAENIIEYVLYMFHTEDVIRSCQLNLDLINSAIIEPSELGKEEKVELLAWYKDVVGKMEKDNIEDRGHLAEVIEVIGELSFLHSRMITDSTNTKYKSKYDAANSYLVEISQKSSGATLNPIELAINGIYGVMTLKMKKQEVFPETLEAVKTFTDFLSYLGKVYHLAKRGEYRLN
ncbi:MAG: DUF4924 family protein [Salibacteraceae bacterium]